MQRVTINIGVVGEHVTGGCRRARQGRVAALGHARFLHHCGVAHRYRRVVHGIHGDVQLGCRQAALAVGQGVGHRRHRTVPVRLGREGVAAIGVDREQSARHRSAAARRVGVTFNRVAQHAQGVAVRVAVGCDRGAWGATRNTAFNNAARDDRVFVAGNCIIVGDRRRVGHRPREVLRTRRAAGVRRRHGDGVFAVSRALARRMVHGAADDACGRINAQARGQARRRIGQRRVVHIGEPA
ncbi:hypothetical protein CDEF62S_04811 [Castellaniella defragrans]